MIRDKYDLSVAEKLSYFSFRSITDLLYKCQRHKFRIPDLVVRDYYQIVGETINEVASFYNIELDRFDLPADSFIIKVSFKRKKLIINIGLHELANDRELSKTLVPEIIVSTTNGNTVEAKEMIELLKTYSISHSYLNNKLLSLGCYKGDILDSVELVKIPWTSLDRLFINKLKKDQIERFISTAMLDNPEAPLRFLLNGPPGTGKTEIIKSIITRLKDHITILIVKEIQESLSPIFTFLSNFENSLLIIDDLDLTIQNRGDNYFKNNLSIFLSHLDGLIRNNIFIIASTNDKKLVDLAASRPGRFDLILDIASLDPQCYLELIHRETNEPEILSLLETNFLNLFIEKNVTGAFIVNFIKQLKNINQFEEVNLDYAYKLFDLTYRGFYKTNADQELIKAVGF